MFKPKETNRLEKLVSSYILIFKLEVNVNTTTTIRTALIKLSTPPIDLKIKFTPDNLKIRVTSRASKQVKR